MPTKLHIWFTNDAGASLSFLFLSCCTSLRVVLLRRFAPEAFSMSRLVTSARTFVGCVYGQSSLHAASAKGHLRSSFVVCLKHFCLCQSKDVLRTFDKVGPRSKIFKKLCYRNWKTMVQLEKEIMVFIGKLEKILPLGCFDPMQHLLNLSIFIWTKVGIRYSINGCVILK